MANESTNHETSEPPRLTEQLNNEADAFFALLPNATSCFPVDRVSPIVNEIRWSVQREGVDVRVPVIYRNLAATYVLFPSGRIWCGRFESEGER